MCARTSVLMATLSPKLDVSPENGQRQPFRNRLVSCSNRPCAGVGFLRCLEIPLKFALQNGRSWDLYKTSITKCSGQDHTNFCRDVRRIRNSSCIRALSLSQNLYVLSPPQTSSITSESFNEPSHETSPNFDLLAST